jgi:tyrosine-protein kinase Etk/Wzc
MATQGSHPAARNDSVPDPQATEVSEVYREVSVLDLLIIFAERRKFVLTTTLAFAVLAIIVSLLLPKRYTAMVTLLPPQQGSSTSAALAQQFGNLGGMAALAGNSLGLKNPNEMLVALMRSRTVEDAMVQRFELMKEYRETYPSEARKDLEKHTTIDGSGKDGLIHLSIEDRDSNRAAELANGYIDQFRKLSEHMAISEASQRRLFFEQQLADAKNELAAAEQALMFTEEHTGLIQLDSQSRALIESAAALRAQVMAKEVQIKSLETFATSENAQVVQARQELQGLQAQLARLGGSGDSSDLDLIVPKGKVPGAGLEYVRKLRDVKYYETIFDILARQFEMAKLDEAKQGALIQVVDAAVAPDRRSFPKRGLIVVAVTLLGFLVSLVAALILHGYQQTKLNPATARKIETLSGLISFRRT